MTPDRATAAAAEQAEQLAQQQINAVRLTAESGGGEWGGITGTLADQTDLQTALNLKSATSHNHTGVYQPVATGTPTGTKFLRDDNSWQAPPSSGGGSIDDALAVAVLL